MFINIFSFNLIFTLVVLILIHVSVAFLLFFFFIHALFYCFILTVSSCIQGRGVPVVFPRRLRAPGGVHPGRDASVLQSFTVFCLIFYSSLIHLLLQCLIIIFLLFSV